MHYDDLTPETQVALENAHENILEALTTYVPTSTAFRNVLMDELVLLAGEIEMTLKAKHSSELLQVVNEGSHTILEMALVAIDIAHKKDK